MSTSGREFRAYSAHSVTRERGAPTWSDLVCASIGRVGTQVIGSEAEFFGRLCTWHVGCLQFVLARVQGASLRATPGRGVPANTHDAWLGLCLEGHYEIGLDARATEVRPGQFAVLNAANLRTMTFSASCELLWVKVPRVFLPGPLHDGTDLIIDGARGAGRLVHHTLRDIVDQAQEPDLGDTDAIAEGVIKLISAAVPPLRATSRGAQSAHRASALKRIKQYVDHNLGSEALSLQSVADALGLSARYINKLFESECTSLMRWTWARRLDRAHFALQTGGCRPISEVAYAFGFKNPSHFSRTFRARYGYAPSRLMEAGVGAPS